MKVYTKLAILVALCAGSALHACQLSFTNDTHEIAHIMPIKEPGKQSKAIPVTLMPGQKNVKYGDPHERAHFSVSLKGKRYELKQIACSKSHLIHINLSDILNDSFDKELFSGSSK